MMSAMALAGLIVLIGLAVMGLVHDWLDWRKSYREDVAECLSRKMGESSEEANA